MQQVEAGRLNPELREIVIEASLALARLDAGRLEEMAVSCQALNRDLAPLSEEMRAELVRQAHDAAGEIRVFGRILEATRANLNVMRRLRELRDGRLEYGGRIASRLTDRGQWALSEDRHGND
jgi:hypothetical protein